MRISEVARRSGVTVPTIKYYLREGMLPPGTPLNPRDAQYSETHLERLEIIRNLREIAHLSIDTIKHLLNAADNPDLPIPALVGLAHAATLPRTDAAPLDEQAQALATRFYAELNWTIPARHPVFGQTARLLSLLQASGGPSTPDALQDYVQAVQALAQAELGLTRRDASRLLLVHDVAVGTYLGQQLLLTLHMAAQVNQALRHFPPASEPAPEPPQGTP